MLVVNRKTVLLRNLLSIIPFVVLFVVNNIVGFQSNLPVKILITLVSGFWFIFAAMLNTRKIKHMFENIYIIYGLLFFVYSIMGCLVFVLDGMTPRFFYFKITQSSLSETLTIYTNIFCLYSCICFVLNKIRPLNLKDRIKQDNSERSINNKTMVFFAAFAIIVSVINISKIFAGESFFSLSVSGRREILNGDLSHYANLFMASYSLFVAYLSIVNKKRPNNIVLLPIILFWASVLTCERRMFVTFLLGLVLIVIINSNKLRGRYLVLIAMAALALLSLGAFRDNITLKNHKINDVIYSSTTEFYCTFMVSDAYVVSNHQLQYGKTYVVDTISKAVPRSVFEDKPEDLSVQFMNEYKTNVGFAYNPVAEGLLNFGKMAQIIVPVIMVVVCAIAVRLGKHNVIHYIVCAMFSLDFCRGAFSNMAFDIVFCCLVIKALLYFAKKRKETK